MSSLDMLVLGICDCIVSYGMVWYAAWLRIYDAGSITASQFKTWRQFFSRPRIGYAGGISADMLVLVWGISLFGICHVMCRHRSGSDMPAEALALPIHVKRLTTCHVMSCHVMRSDLLSNLLRNDCFCILDSIYVLASWMQGLHLRCRLSNLRINACYGLIDSIDVKSWHMLWSSIYKAAHLWCRLSNLSMNERLLKRYHT
jgi:hypothetical protein